MILDVASLLSIAGACAPSVAPETLLSIVHTESRFNSLAIGVNSPGVRQPRPATKAQAIAAARSLIRQGYNIDLGLGQINSANLGWLELSVEDAFEPCRNLAAAARVLAKNYQAVMRIAPSRDHAIATALSLYNTGDRRRGFRNGYVARVYASASVVIPLIRGTAPVATASAIAPTAPAFTPPPDTTVSTPLATGWNTAARASQASLMVFGDGAASLKGLHP
ncbi:type IV secretion system protein VirB1 [Sphingomonas laterariae]|jgi:type IV secretion system protein VirB1|uniref:Type IV secretion system protein VirB1 n=1 Tax=Edaphosphingomonas laterariae TaxID=861865 RepID=A0A239IT27_9SPHN|nr:MULTISPECIES: lytic transglycosylase domain-containing protein [Sphingomonadales]MBA4759906.1 lytic transglycosylase domain-containing protein [Sphingosinicella sp.]SNS96183.1 type IV secretion system protein VirB1 [Sphingomonas laterariae]